MVGHVGAKGAVRLGDGGRDGVHAAALVGCVCAGLVDVNGYGRHAHGGHVGWHCCCCSVVSLGEGKGVVALAVDSQSQGRSQEDVCALHLCSFFLGPITSMLAIIDERTSREEPIVVG